MQELALAHCTFLEGQLFHGLAIGQMLQILVAGEGETMGKKAFEVAEDGTRYAAGAHAGDAERQRRKGRRERRARDDPRGGADERDA